jgi:tetratricopeptide (TPR) repeat protein
MDASRRCAGFVQREIVFFLVAAVAVMPLFLLTRAAARWNRRSHAATAAYWYNQGREQERQGNNAGALESFRSAVVNDHDNHAYGLALAAALSSQNRDAEAKQALLRLREASPEDPDINLQLARLAAKQSQPSDALRYYHIALDGLWGNGGSGNDAPGRANQRIATHIEFIEFLLRHRMRNQALSELLALTAELPEGGPSFDRAAKLFLEAGDPRRALDSFSHALRINRHDEQARLGVEQSRQLLSAESPLRAQPMEPQQ